MPDGKIEADVRMIFVLLTSRRTARTSHFPTNIALCSLSGETSSPKERDTKKTNVADKSQDLVRESDGYLSITRVARVPLLRGLWRVNGTHQRISQQIVRVAAPPCHLAQSFVNQGVILPVVREEVFSCPLTRLTGKHE